jgi:hypothetical protein
MVGAPPRIDVEQHEPHQLVVEREHRIVRTGVG